MTELEMDLERIWDFVYGILNIVARDFVHRQSKYCFKVPFYMNGPLLGDGCI